MVFLRTENTRSNPVTRPLSSAPSSWNPTAQPRLCLGPAGTPLRILFLIAATTHPRLYGTQTRPGLENNTNGFKPSLVSRLIFTALQTLKHGQSTAHLLHLPDVIYFQHLSSQRVRVRQTSGWDASHADCHSQDFVLADSMCAAAARYLRTSLPRFQLHKPQGKARRKGVNVRDPLTRCSPVLPGTFTSSIFPRA